MILDTGQLTLVYLCSWFVGLRHDVVLDTGQLTLVYLCRVSSGVSGSMVGLAETVTIGG